MFCYVVQYHCERQTTILCIEVIGKMSISTNNWICPSLTDMSKGGQIVEALLFKMENNTDYWQLDIWAQQHYKVKTLENEGLTVDSFIPIILLHTVAYALLKILNVCRAVAIFCKIRLYKLNSFKNCKFL